MSDDDDFDMEPVVPRARKKKKGGALKVGLIVLLVLLGLIAAGAAGAWYFWLSEWYGSASDGPVPVVRADPAPIKVKPKEPGGMAVPDRDKLVYQRMNGGAPAPSGMERLLPPAEEPVAPPMPAVPVPNPAQVPPPPLGAPKPLTAPSPTAAPAVPAMPAPTVSAPTMPAKAGAPVSLAPKPMPAPAAPAPATAPMVPKTQAPPSAAAKADRLPPAAPAKAAAKSPLPSGATGGYRIQLGAVRAENAAEAEWKRLQNLHKDVLGALSLSVVRADLGAKGVYYRLRGGPFADADAASAACATLKARKAPCFPVPPGK